MKPKILLYFFIPVVFFSCIERTYYVSPGYGNSMPYHTLPLSKDSIKSNLYFNGSLLAGSANYDLRDNQYAINANIYNAHTFSMFKAWYGGGITLGDYVVKTYNNNSYIYDSIKAGGKFYGSLNANGGMAFTLPLGKSEWRIIGVQASLQQEFGNYLSFRKKIKSDSIAVDGNTTNALLPTIGVSTEFALKVPDGVLSLLIQYNTLMGKDYRYYSFSDNIYDPNNISKLYRYGYFTTVLSYSENRFTGYLQTNSGTRMNNIQAGINYSLSRRYRNK